nr:hypothetical protein [Vibrio anguillarum]
MEDAGFWLVDRLIWQSNKAPTPYAWTSLNRYMLKASFEFCLHFTNNPLALQSNNQRVLLPHSQQHRQFVHSGGVRKAAINSDGAHTKNVGDYSRTDLEKGKLASNNLYFANKCAHNETVNRFAREHGLPTHGAKMPYRLAEFLVKYLCPAGGRASILLAALERPLKRVKIRVDVGFQSNLFFNTSNNPLSGSPH